MNKNLIDNLAGAANPTTDDEKIQYLIMGLAYAAKFTDDHVNQRGASVDASCKSIASLIQMIQSKPAPEYWADRFKGETAPWIVKEMKRLDDELQALVKNAKPVESGDG